MILNNNTNLDVFSFLAKTGKALQEKLSLRVDIKERKEDFQVFFDLPGVKKENIEIKIKNGVLNVSTKIEEVEEQETVDKEKFLLRERFSQKYKKERTLDFGDSVSGDVTAKFDNGVLEIVLKKTNPDTEEKSIAIE